jgi:hypothetical protein
MTNPNSFPATIETDLIETEERRSRRTVVRDEQGMVSTSPPDEVVMLVGVELQNAPNLLTLQDSLAELALLSKTAGLRVVGSLTQRLAPGRAQSSHADRRR